MERGMKKWRPFAALPEYEDYYSKMLKDREKKPQPCLSDDQEEEINSAFQSAKPGDFFSVRIYEKGFFYQIDGDFVKADAQASQLILTTGAIAFDKIVKINNN